MPEPPGILALYPHLRETPSRKPSQRTDWNVRDAEALLVLVGLGGIDVSEGTQRAIQHAEGLSKSVAIVSVVDDDTEIRVCRFLKPFDNRPVCIAGPRESESPGLQRAALRVLGPALSGQVAGN
jgi:hypothetical protein